MAKATRTIQLMLIDGEPDGRLSASILHEWSGNIFVSRRTQAQEALQREEAGRSGVYLLVGEKKGKGSPLLYIGESENIRNRIKTHDMTKEWWTSMVFITSSAAPLSKSHIRYLEYRLLEKARNVKRIELENTNKASKGTMSESDVGAMENFLSNIYLLLPALQFDFFVQNVRPAHSSISSVSKEGAPVFVLNTQKHDLKARATIVDGHFVVEVGSQAQKKWIGTTTKDSSYGKLHKELLSQGVLEIKDDFCIFTTDYAFKSASAAGAVVYGRPTAGPTAWKLEGTKTTYKDWEAERIGETKELQSA